MRIKVLLLFCFASFLANAQQPALQFFRPNNKLCLNLFETNKADTVIFDGVKLRIGGDFAMQFQGLNQNHDGK